MTDGARIPRKPIEQVRIHVRSDAEREDTREPRVFVRRQAHDLLLLQFPDRGQPVGQEHDEVGPSVAADRLHGQGLLDGFAHRRSADRLQAFHKLHRLLDVRVRRSNDPAEKCFRFRGKADDLEPVVAVQVGQAEPKRLLRLVQLAFGHRAGRIDHETDVLGQGLLRFVVPRGRKQEEVPVLVRVTERQQVNPERLRCAREDHLEIRVRAAVGLFVTDHGLVLPVPGDFRVVRGAVDCSQRVFRLDTHANRHVLHWGGTEFLRVQGIDVFRESRIAFQQFRVADLDAFVRCRFDRKDTDLEGAPADVFQERGVPGLADDLLVERPGLVRRQEFSGQLLAVDVHDEGVDVRSFGKGEDVGAFHAAVVGVVEILVDGRRGHLSFDIHFHLVVDDLQRSEPEMAGNMVRRVMDHDQPVRIHRNRDKNQDQCNQP